MLKPFELVTMISSPATRTNNRSLPLRAAGSGSSQKTLQVDARDPECSQSSAPFNLQKKRAEISQRGQCDESDDSGQNQFEPHCLHGAVT